MLGLIVAPGRKVQDLQLPGVDAALVLFREYPLRLLCLVSASRLGTGF
jgi:hypothetical protein